MNSSDYLPTSSRGFANRRKDHPTAKSLGKVKVIHGIRSATFDNLVNMNVASVLATLKTMFNISNDTVALVNGKKVGMDYRLKASDVLEFVKPFGRKGGDLLTPEEVIAMWRISRKQYKKWLAEDGLPLVEMGDGSVRHFKLALEEWEKGQRAPKGDPVVESPTSAATPR